MIPVFAISCGERRAQSQQTLLKASAAITGVSSHVFFDTREARRMKLRHTSTSSQAIASATGLVPSRLPRCAAEQASRW